MRVQSTGYKAQGIERCEGHIGQTLYPVLCTLYSHFIATKLRALPLLLCAMLLAGRTAAQNVFPYELRTGREVGIAATGAGLLAAALAIRSSQVPLTQSQIDALDVNDINAFDRPATRRWSRSAANASDVLVMTLLASPVALAVAGPGSQEPVILGIMYGEALLADLGIVQVVKGLAERTRPFVYNDDSEIPDELRLEVSARRSFVSGHTANAFTAAVFLSSVYSRLYPDAKARKWVWAGSMGLAGTVGYLRYAGGRHFPTDILGGALVGSAVGYLVPKMHETETVRLMPTGRGIGVSLTF